MEPKSYLLQDSWGVVSLRQSSGYQLEGKYYAPLGCCCVSWEIQTKKRTLCRQIHTDFVSTMIPNNNGVILTVSFGGEIKLWDPSFQMIASYQSPTDNTIYGSWSPCGSDFSICSKGPKQMLIVYNFENVIKRFTEKKDVNCKWYFTAPQSDLTKSILNECTHQRKSYDCFNASVFKHNSEIVAVYQTSNTCELYLISTDGKLLKQSVISPLGEEKNVMLCTSNIHNDIIAIGLQHGVFGFYNIDSLELLTVLQATGSPQICLWHNETFITMSYVTGIMTTWDRNGTMLREIKGMYVYYIQYPSGFNLDFQVKEYSN